MARLLGKKKDSLISVCKFSTSLNYIVIMQVEHISLCCVWTVCWCSLAIFERRKFFFSCNFQYSKLSKIRIKNKRFSYVLMTIFSYSLMYNKISLKTCQAKNLVKKIQVLGGQLDVLKSLTTQSFASYFSVQKR